MQRGNTWDYTRPSESNHRVYEGPENGIIDIGFVKIPGRYRGHH